MTTEVKTLLEEYSKELKLRDCITVAELIESHRNIRGIIRQYMDQDSELMEGYRANAKKIAEEGVLKGEYISIESLKKMTMLDIANMLSSDS